jgi:hypothetical protein
MFVRSELCALIVRPLRSLTQHSRDTEELQRLIRRIDDKSEETFK